MGTVRKTKSVNTLLSRLGQTNEAISVVDLVDELQSEMNKTTVYRILDRLEGAGTLHSFIGKDGLKWYAKCEGCSSTHHVDTHPHFQCKDCGKTICLPMDVSIPDIPNHKIESASLLLIGRCENCMS